MGCGSNCGVDRRAFRVLGRRDRVCRFVFTHAQLAAAALAVAVPVAADAQTNIPLSPTAQASGARLTVDQGIEFVTIGAPGNAAWQGTSPPTPGDDSIGRGSVNYEYRIGRFEVTTAQWAEFFSAAMDRPVNDRLPHLLAPSFWGAQPASGVNGGTRYVVPAGNEMRPVGDISWRMAAIYCNWLHNDKRTDRAAFLNGAYDVSTFGGAIFTDQATRSPGAKFFIPTLDEWLKAAHYDPNRNGAGPGGYWQYSITSDTEPLGGRPPGWPGSTGRGQVNAGWADGSQYAVPLGAYPTVQSPWGLLDTGGATTEWTEEIVQADGIKTRVYDGSWWTDGSPGIDSISNWGGDDFPGVPIFPYGFRIAAAIPAPSVGVMCAVAACFSGLSRRRREALKFDVRRRGLLAASVPLVLGSSALAQTNIPLSPTAQASGARLSTDQGIEFVTIGSPGNAAWPGIGAGDFSAGRGSVAYEYRIGRMEVTTAQWAEFYNAVGDRPAGDSIPFVQYPTSFWGGVSATPTNPGGRRYAVPAGNENRPVGSISCRTAAIYCNWLHNGKSTDPSAFLSGAYDVSTFGFVGSTFTDQLTHSPGARFWIPTWDEWLKAAHFDPNKNGQGQSGWWTYSTTSDTVPVAGPPGERVTKLSDGRIVRDPNGTFAQVNTSNWTSTIPDISPFTIPLGAYPTVQSPWGLLDVAGATAEWTESTLSGPGYPPREFLTAATGSTAARRQTLFQRFSLSHPISRDLTLASGSRVRSRRRVLVRSLCAREPYSPDGEEGVVHMCVRSVLWTVMVLAAACISPTVQAQTIRAELNGSVIAENVRVVRANST